VSRTWCSRLPEQSQEGRDPRDARAFEAAKRFIEAQAVDEEDAAGFSRKRRSKPAAKAAPKAAAASSRGLQPRKGTAPAGAFPRGPRRSTPSAADVGSKRPRSTSGGQDGAEGNSDEGSDDGEEELDGAEDWHAASDRSRKQRSTNPSAVRVRRHRENQRRQQQQQQEGSAAASAPASAAPGAGAGGVGGRRGAKRKDGRPAQVARMWPADALLELVWVAGLVAVIRRAVHARTRARTEAVGAGPERAAAAVTYDDELYGPGEMADDAATHAEAPLSDLRGELIPGGLQELVKQVVNNNPRVQFEEWVIMVIRGLRDCVVKVQVALGTLSGPRELATENDIKNKLKELQNKTAVRDYELLLR